jgi:hypothetical protein
MSTKMVDFRKLLTAAIALAGLVVLTGCGTTALVHKQAESVAQFDPYKTLTITSSVAEGVVMPEPVRERVEELVKANLESKYCPKRFQSISTKEPAPDDLVLLIKYTTYDEGNRFARFMMAGLGGIKIHSDIIVKNTKSDEALSHGEVGKTFRWGGIYGATTDIAEIEKWFAEETAKTFAGMIGVQIPADETQPGKE